MKLQGIFPALTTPFDAAGHFLPEKLRANVEKLNRIALGGYAVGGSTGETALLSFEERLMTFRCVKEAAADGRTLVAGVTAESVQESARLANDAAAIGLHVALALTPSYYPNQMRRPETQALYFRALADRSKIPVLLYNMPAVTGYDLPLEIVVDLSQHSNIIGIKDSSGNVDKVKQVVATAKPGFQVLSGSGTSFGDALQAGAAGAILAIADAVPYACVTVWEAFRTRQIEAAVDWQTRLLPAARALATQYGIAGLKYAMELNGYYGGPPRLPLLPLTRAEQQEIAMAFDGLRS